MLATTATRMDEFESSLNDDEEGNPIFPENGEVGHRFRPENVDNVYNRIKQVQGQTMRALVKFKHNQGPVELNRIKDTALCVFLKGSDTKKAILVEIRATQNPANIPLDKGDHAKQVLVIPVVSVDQQEEEENIVIDEVAEAGGGVTPGVVTGTT